MNELWVPLKDIPAEGREFHFTDQSLWTGPIREFAVSGRIAKPFSARLAIVPRGGGFAVSGEFSGSLIVPCDRCAEEFELPLSASFEEFVDPRAGAEEEAEAQDALAEGHLRLNDGEPELDAAGLLWEQFVLTLPVSPLCREDCKGLCPVCGANRNLVDCGCASEAGDPRLSVLRTLKLQ